VPPNGCCNVRYEETIRSQDGSCIRSITQMAQSTTLGEIRRYGEVRSGLLLLAGQKDGAGVDSNRNDAEHRRPSLDEPSEGLTLLL
ncbi:MAG TPA: hypothetical protein QGF35_06555, partial [Dehalococcoidia bacterium]|nr:hypothetical protein [Dehalococcoidia bacterium]